MSDTVKPTETTPQVASDPDAVSITVNGVEHAARKGQLLIDALADAGEYVPRFCYHERLSPVGKCRMCLVECDTGRGPAITVSCMVPVAPGMKVDTQGETTKRMQEGVLELFLANHPLDCPVCDKGGECPLQDQAVSHGPGESRYLEEKRHFEKPIAVSDLVYLDRERCILCDRCTRFADEVGSDALIHFAGRGNNTYITTFPDQPFASYFSGNTVQICPVGALTARPYRFKARPWDLRQQESTCTTCAVGCRIAVQSSHDEVLRHLGVDSDPVNHGWLCDRGRFNYEQLHSADRVLQPLVRAGDDLLPATWSEALAEAATALGAAKAAGGAGSIAVLGGARGTNEDAYAWARLAHEVIGTPNVYAQMGDGLPADLLVLERATIDEAAAASTVVLIGPDLKEELPVLYLRLREAAVKGRTRLLEFTPKLSGLSTVAWRSIAYEPGTLTAAIDTALADDQIAAQLASGPVVVVAGRANLAESSTATVQAVRTVLAKVPGSTVLPAFRRGNVIGALQVGMRPTEGGLDTRGVLQAAADGGIECLVLLGADPVADFPDADLARRALAGARRVIAVDTFLTASSAQADVVLAACAFAEKAGTTTNIEGRVSPVARQVTPAGSTRPDWMIAVELAEALGGDLGYDDVGQITADIAENVDGYTRVTPEALSAAADGVVAYAPTGIGPVALLAGEAPARSSYDFRLIVSRTLYDQAEGTAHSPSLAHLTTATTVHVNPLDLGRIGTTDGATVKLTSSKASVVCTITGDESVLRGTAWMPFRHPGVDPRELIDCFAHTTDLRIENP